MQPSCRYAAHTWQISRGNLLILIVREDHPLPQTAMLSPLGLGFGFCEAEFNASKPPAAWALRFFPVWRGPLRTLYFDWSGGWLVIRRKNQTPNPVPAAPLRGRSGRWLNKGRDHRRSICPGPDAGSNKPAQRLGESRTPRGEFFFA